MAEIERVLQQPDPKENTMSLLLLLVLLLVVFGGLPNWGYHNYGYAPSGLGGIILIVVLVLFLSGRLHI
jgi:hypothetical protein